MILLLSCLFTFVFSDRFLQYAIVGSFIVSIHILCSIESMRLLSLLVGLWNFCSWKQMNIYQPWNTVKDVQKAWKLCKLQMLPNFIDAYHTSLCYKPILSVTFDMSCHSSRNSKWRKCRNILFLRYYIEDFSHCMVENRTYHQLNTMLSNNTSRRTIRQARNVK